MILAIDIPESAESDENLYGDIYESLIPDNLLISEADRVQSAVNDVIPWPQSSDIINEFTCEGYVSMAFPTLLPYGSAELNNYSRATKITVTEYFQFLMQYEDRRFTQDPRFRYLALNTIQRHQAVQKGTIFAKKILLLELYSS